MDWQLFPPQLTLELQGTRLHRR